MAISTDNLLQPLGELDPKLFPGMEDDALESALHSYIEEGTAEAAARLIPGGSVDKAVTHWAYARAYHVVYLRLLATPRAATIEGQGQRTYGADQAAGFLTLSQQHRAIFDGLVPLAGAPTVPEHPPSASFRHRLSW